MSIPRGLSDYEAAAWAKLAASVTPMEGRVQPPLREAQAAKSEPPKAVVTKPVPVPAKPAPTPPSRSSTQENGLDGHWDRRIKSGAIQPDFTLDLHGYSLDAAYDRLMSGLDQALAMDSRVVLLIAGRSRPVDPADRGHKRGAIRAKILDWLAASRHENAIAAVRRAHIRHGGEGALYLVLKRRR